MSSDHNAGEPLQLLLIKHDSADAELCVIELERAGFDVYPEIVAKPTELTDAVSRRRFDIALTDYRLPDWTGMEALALLRQAGLDIPVVMMTGALGDERAVECLKQGASDYVLKSNLERLPFAVRRALNERRLGQEHAQSMQIIRKLTQAVEQGPASVIVTDTSGTIEYVNSRFTEITGYSAEEVIGRNPRLLKSGQTPPEVYRNLWSTIQGGEVWRAEIVNRRKNGELYYDLVSISPIRDATGEVSHFLAVQEDTTARHQTQEALEESEARFRKLVEASFDGIIISRNGIIVESNSGFNDMFGYPADEVIGQPIMRFVAPESLAAVASHLKGGTEGRHEFIGRRKDGHKIILEATARNHTVEGAPGRLTALRDLTEQRGPEEGFRQAQKMEAIGRLAGGIAHDFNNLLTTIDAGAHFLLEDLPTDSPLREDALEIRRAADRAASLTRQLLTFSHKQVLEPRILDLNTVVTQSERMLGRLVGEDIGFVSKLHCEPVRVEGDETQVQQILMNLAVNARDAMPTGGVITIETGIENVDEAHAVPKSTAPAGYYAMLAVGDTGTGMDEETRRRLFEPFFTTKGLGKGTGFGLATVYGIVIQNEGFIDLLSEPGAGSTFKIYLPLAEQPTTPNSGTDPLFDGLPQGTESVLLAEDEPAVRAAVRQMLERLGYRVIVAPSGSVAINFARKHPGPIHLLLTDVVMPEMSGRELAEEIEVVRPDAKVLFMSGYTDDAILRHGIVKSQFAYLQKPFSPSVLATKVREVLDAAS